MNESDLINEAKQGDNNSFNTLLKVYIKEAHQTAFLILHDYTLAEDAVQEALIQIHSSLKRYDSKKASFKTWINRIVVHCALKQARKKRFTFEFKDELQKKSTDTPHIHLMLKEESQLISDCIQQLAPKYRTVIVLYYFQELSVKNISKVLNIREGTVKSRLYKSRKKLSVLFQSNDIHFTVGREHLWSEK